MFFLIEDRHLIHYYFGLPLLVITQFHLGILSHDGFEGSLFEESYELFSFNNSCQLYVVLCGNMYLLIDEGTDCDGEGGKITGPLIITPSFLHHPIDGFSFFAMAGCDLLYLQPSKI